MVHPTQKETFIRPESSNLVSEKDTAKPSSRFAFCSEYSFIQIVSIESKKEIVGFQGAYSPVNLVAPWAHLKEIPSTSFLCSLFHDYSTRKAIMKVFELSEEAQPREMFSTEVIRGSNGWGFVSVNSKRNFIGVISIGQTITYHLLTWSYDSSSIKDTFKVSRRAKWFSQFSNSKENAVTDLDFDLDGQRAAAIDYYGTCLVADIDTNSYICHSQIGTREDGYFNKNRWAPQLSNSLLFTLCDKNLLNIIDIEKNVQDLTTPIQLDTGYTYSIDLNPSNNNLLAAAGMDFKIRIFDRREAKIVKTFDEMNKSFISSVKWSPDGERLLTTSESKQAKLLNFSNGKEICAAETRDKSRGRSACFL